MISILQSGKNDTRSSYRNRILSVFVEKIQDQQTHSDERRKKHKFCYLQHVQCKLVDPMKLVQQVLGFLPFSRKLQLQLSSFQGFGCP